MIFRKKNKFSDEKNLKERKMKDYLLKPEEVVLFKTQASNNKDILLTNINILLKINDGEQIETEVYPVDSIKIYKEAPQLILDKNSVDIYFLFGETKIDFERKKDARAFVTAVTELLTGKTVSTLRAEKIKKGVNNAVDLIDDTFNIDTMATVKGILEKTPAKKFSKMFVKKNSKE